MEFDLPDRNRRGLFERIAIDPGTDGREADRAHSPLIGHGQALTITGCQKLRFPMAAVTVDRTHGVEHVLGRQSARSRGHCVTGTAGADRRPYRVQFAHDPGPAGPMNRAIHPTAPSQSRIGGVYHCVHCDLRDVALVKYDFATAGAHPFHTIYYNRFVTRRKLLAVAAAGASALWARSRWDRARISAITDEIGNSSDDAVAFAHEFGLQWVEIRNLPGSGKEYALAREADTSADAAHIGNERIKVSCVDTSLLRFVWPGTGQASTDSEKTRWDLRFDDLHKALRCAQIAGADKVRIFAGARVTDPSTMPQRIADTIGEMALEAEKQKINLLLGNDPATNVATCAEMAAVMKLLPSRWVALDWNPHSAYQLEQPFPNGYALLPKKRILNVRALASSLMPGSAETEDWKAILLALDHDGYNGRIALETGAAGSSLVATARAAIEQLLHIVREVS
jgi:sugar phosphate isomerase/epimerase